MTRIDGNAPDHDRRGRRGDGDGHRIRPDEVEAGDARVEQPRVTPLEIETQGEDREDHGNAGVESDVCQDSLRRSSGQDTREHAGQDDACDGYESDDLAPRQLTPRHLLRDLTRTGRRHGSPAPVRFAGRGLNRAALATDDPGNPLDEERPSGERRPSPSDAPGPEDQHDDEDDERNGHLVGAPELQADDIRTFEPDQKRYRHFLGESDQEAAQHRPVGRADSPDDDGREDEQDDVEAHRWGDCGAEAEQDARGGGERTTHDPGGVGHALRINARRLRELEVVRRRTHRFAEVRVLEQDMSRDHERKSDQKREDPGDRMDAQPRDDDDILRGRHGVNPLGGPRDGSDSVLDDQPDTDRGDDRRDRAAAFEAGKDDDLEEDADDG